MEQVIAEHLVWLRLRGLSAGTVWARKRALIRLALALPCPLLAATAADLLAWRAGLQLAPKTIGGYVSHAHQFYAWAVEQDLAAVNPAEGLPVPRRPRLLPRPVAEDALLLALAAAPGRVRPWLVLAAWAGLRAQEIAYLRREDVMDAAPVPVLLVTSRAAKGGDERLIPLSVFVTGELRPVMPARGWVFPRADGRGGPNSPGTVSKLANQHLHYCGVTASLHQLRHRFATEAYRASGRDLRAVQELLGHRSPDTTAGYAAYDAEIAAAAVQAIPVP